MTCIRRVRAHSFARNKPVCRGCCKPLSGSLLFSAKLLVCHPTSRGCGANLEASRQNASTHGSWLCCRRNETKSRTTVCDRWNSTLQRRARVNCYQPNGGIVLYVTSQITLNDCSLESLLVALRTWSPPVLDEPSKTRSILPATDHGPNQNQKLLRRISLHMLWTSKV